MSAPSLDFELITPHCRLRAPQPSDAPVIFSASTYAGFNDGLWWDPPANELAVVQSIEAGRKLWLEGLSYGFSIDRRTTGEFVGQAGVMLVGDKCWELGCWMHPSFQGGPAMMECCHTLMKIAFEVLGAEALVARHVAWNHRSGKMIAALGMQSAGTLEQGLWKEGKWQAAAFARKTKDQWPSPVDLRRSRLYAYQIDHIGDGKAPPPNLQ